MVRVVLLALLVAAGVATPPTRPPARQEGARSPCVVANLNAEQDRAAGADAIRRLFLMRERRWPSGAAAHPVNLPATSELRERFTRALFGQSVQDQAPYWNERYFHGTRPPPTVASEAAMLLFIERTPGAVGYLERERLGELPSGVQSLLCLESESGG
jgi:hypothetical protein